ncbi:outer membrane beta-barrel protein [Flavihumibacter fluvii]|uniref:outer membrane beta-barrel protein n=1 Tax=Flavihumibacter fluvii TaxID=2838157 RepID=UPI001BDE45A2|nr:outer membrane beta-barrel protein [Flavihumibacter fluvii]ULQ52328.1 PorT family protein [Flavihumibacter fluvii]
MLKKITLLAMATIAGVSLRAQTDTAGKTPAITSDTVKIGNIIILKNGGSSNTGTVHSDWDINIYRHNRKKPANLTTTWLNMDFGFNNYIDKTDYNSAETQAFAPGSNENWFNLNNGKSVNFNLWIVMQRLNMVQHKLNLKYGIGLEYYNFRYEEDIRYSKNPPAINLDEVIDYSKNKLALNYVTVPLMLNYNFTPQNSEFSSFGLSAGISASYLYNSRQKYISDETGKEKLRGDLGLEDFKLAYIGEIKLGPVSLYGSYAFKSMFKKGLDQTPYAVGIRLGTWY